MKVLGLSLPKKYPIWLGVLIGVVTIAALFLSKGGAQAIAACPGSQVYCAGVGCVSGKDKCVPMNPDPPVTTALRIAHRPRQFQHPRPFANVFGLPVHSVWPFRVR